MPAVALGTWPMNNAETAEAVEGAVSLGYRHIDTAENYGNERGVGEGIRRSGIDRSEMFITTKFNRAWHSIDGVRRAWEASTDRLGVDVLDLFLVHWPNPDRGTYVDAVRGLVALRDEGAIRAFGVSNFKRAHLQRLVDEGLIPEVNQIQLDPEHSQVAAMQHHRELGIGTAAYSPLRRRRALLQAAAPPRGGLQSVGARWRIPPGGRHRAGGRCPREDLWASRSALANSAGQRGRAKVGVPRPTAGEPQPLRFCAERRGNAVDQCTRLRGAAASRRR